MRDNWRVGSRVAAPDAGLGGIEKALSPLSSDWPVSLHAFDRLRFFLFLFTTTDSTLHSF